MRISTWIACNYQFYAETFRAIIFDPRNHKYGEPHCFCRVLESSKHTIKITEKTLDDPNAIIIPIWNSCVLWINEIPSFKLVYFEWKDSLCGGIVYEHQEVIEENGNFYGYQHEEINKDIIIVNHYERLSAIIDCDL